MRSKRPDEEEDDESDFAVVDDIEIPSHEEVTQGKGAAALGDDIAEGLAMYKSYKDNKARKEAADKRLKEINEAEDTEE